MAWQDRLKEGIYTPPISKKPFKFLYENVSRQTLKKTTAYEFPDSNSTYIQDLGHSSKRYPLRCIFWGDDHDKEAAAFEDALNEQGIGRLQHPFYGNVDVVVFELISRRDNLKTSSNQTIIEVSFWETIRLSFPVAQKDTGSEIREKIVKTNTAQSDEAKKKLTTTNEGKLAKIKAKYMELLDKSKKSLDEVARFTKEVQKNFDDINKSIDAGIDVLIRDPLTLSFQTLLSLQSPGRSAAAILDRLSAYSNLAGNIFSQATNGNIFGLDEIFTTGAVTGSIISVLETQFITKKEAILSAALIVDLADAVEIYKENNKDVIDTGETYQQLQEAVALTAGFLVELSFTLKQEKRIVLDRDRTIIDLCGELFGSIDDQIDFLIASNELNGSEILELPKGKEIVYFV